MEDEVDGDPVGGGDELLGRTLDGRFRIDEVIGEGGMGKVYLGHQLSVERDVAVKVLHGELTVNEELRERFFREAKVVSGFSHPNIVKLIDFGRDEETGLLYLVMELIDGVGLEDLVERGRLAPELALRIAYQTAGALIEAHDKGVIHRDLKAENLILVPVADGRLQTKVVDFGIAYPTEASERLTMTGRIYGTASYMAPEQAQGHDVDARADLFSLGVLLFEMLVGRLPIEGTSSMQVMIKQIQEGPPALSQVVGSGTFPHRLTTLVDSLLSPHPGERPESAERVREILEEIFEREQWTQIKLDTGLERDAMFEDWLESPLEIDEGGTVERGAEMGGEVDSQMKTPKAGALSAQGPSGDAAAGDNPEFSGGAGAETPDDRPMSESTGDSASQKRGLLIVAILLGLILVAAVPVVGYFAIRYFRPDVGSPMDLLQSTRKQQTTADATAANPSPAPTESNANERPANTEADERAREKSLESLGPETDPVCGRIDRVPLPKRWHGRYRPQGADENESRRLEVDASKLNVRWDGGGGTIYVARNTRDRDRIELSCGRYAGTGDGGECSGTLRRSGPVLTLELTGAPTCAAKFSTTWLPE